MDLYPEDIQKLTAVVNAKFSGAPPVPHVMEQLAALKHGSELSFLLPWSKGVNVAELTRQEPFKVLPSIVSPSEAHTKWFVEQCAGIARGLHQIESRINEAYSCRQGRKDYDYGIHRNTKPGDLAHYFHKKKRSSHIISRAQFWEDFDGLLAGLHTGEPDSSYQAPRHHRHEDSEVDDFLLNLGPVDRVTGVPLIITDFGHTHTREAWRNDQQMSGIDSHRDQTDDEFLVDCLHAIQNRGPLLDEPPFTTDRLSSVHDDLKPENMIWFTSSGESRVDVGFKITDFGITNMGSRLYSSSECCTNSSAEAIPASPATTRPIAWDLDLGALFGDILDWSRIDKESQNYSSGRTKISQRKSVMPSHHNLAFRCDSRSGVKRFKFLELQMEIY